ncbi:MAG: hypothetical protein GQ582_02805 [Methyloprofundus sp.]|nr:hypothetical protein [Methyloprofundus sp.]
MKKTIFLLVKIFDNEDYAKQFINGNLYANTLAYFKAMEGDEVANRADKHEGTGSWHQPEKIQLILNGKDLTGGLAGPISIQMHKHTQVNVFCMYAVHSGEFDHISNENLSAFTKQLELPDECEKLGQYAVVVTDVTQFIERIKIAINKKNYGLQATLVDYYDPNSFNGFFPEEKAIFMKRKEYSHQSEYRFAIDTGLGNDTPINLFIEDISDISILRATSDLRKFQWNTAP